MAELWREAVEEATARGRLNSALRSYSLFFACTVAAKQLQAEEDEAEDHRINRMTLEEAEREQLRPARRAIQADPRLAIRAAASLGWEVRPRNEKEWVPDGSLH